MEAGNVLGIPMSWQATRHESCHRGEVEMSRKMMVDGKPVDFKSLFEDEESSANTQETAGAAAASQTAEESAADWWTGIKDNSAASLQKMPRPGEAIEVVVITVGTDNILFAGRDSGLSANSSGSSGSSGSVFGRIEGVISRDEFTKEELAAMTPGSPLRIFVASASRKGEVTSIEGSRQSRGASSAGASGGNVDALREAQASGLPVSGKVTGENKGGYEVTLQGAKGFVPFSQMDIGPRLAADQYIGQTFEFLVTRVEGRNVVLSRAALQREAQEAGREQLLASLEVGQMVSATIRKIESFGLFVELGSGISALVPQSEAAWSRGQALHSRFTPGETAMVKIIKIESFQGKPRIAASIKQADADPWDTMPDCIAPGRHVQGSVTRLAEFGAFVEIAPGIEALLHISEMSAKRRINRPAAVVQAGQQITIRVTAVDRIKKRISVSLKEIEAADDVGTPSMDPVEVAPSTISVPAKGNAGSVLAAAFLKAGKK